MRARFYAGWLVAASAVIGIMFGITVLGTVTFGYFVGPLREEFGWTEIEAALALSVYLAGVTASLPFVGRLVDRFGARRIVLPSMLLYALCLASLSLLTDSLLQLYVAYGALAVLGAGLSPVPFARALSLWFDRRRGLALGLALTGGGLGLSALPRITQTLIDGFGWRGAYLGLAALVFGIALPIVWLLLRDAPSTEEALIERRADALPVDRSNLPGFERNEALMMRQFWIMAVSFAGLGLAIAGCNAYLPRILLQHGVTIQEATSVQAAMGIAAIAGRLLGGFLMDRIYAPIVAVVSGMCAVAGVLLLTGLTGFGVLAVLIGVMLGFATGVEGDVVSYLTSRFFGARRFAELYGWFAFAYLAGGALGPMLMGLSADALGSYDRGLYAFATSLIVGSLMLLALGPYPHFPARAAQAAIPAPPPGRWPAPERSSE